MIPTYDDVVAAAERIKNEAVRTPLLQFSVLNELVGTQVFVKPENLQRTGSFKFRGAYNALSCLSAEELAGGIIAASSGNHAQGVAAAAKLIGTHATILMPADAPKIKAQRTRDLGATVVEYDRETQDREILSNELIAETGKSFVHPFNDCAVIAGQGTLGLEIIEDMEAIGQKPDRMLVCTGGGGLTSGVALSMKHHVPELNVHPVEPEGFDDYKRSLEAGELLRNEKTTGSVCDAIISPIPGAIGFEINKRLLSEGLLVSDKEALAAVRFAFEELKLVVEPGGAVALAAAIKFGHQWKGEKIALVLSGGNIDQELFQAVLDGTA